VKIELHEHQRLAIQKMHDGCVLWGGVGTGKTITALAYALLRHAGKHIVVVTTAKKRDSGDWEHEAGLLAVPFDGIEVTSWNKIGEFVDRKDTFFIFDEQRLVGTGAWVKFFYKIAKNNPWILLSATPGDTWSDYAPMFIANGWYKNITEFRTTHAVYSRYSAFPKIERYIGEGRLVKYRDYILVEMPMDRHTTRHMHDVPVEFDAETLDLVRKKRWNVYEEKPLKNAAELFGVMRKVVSTDPSRRTALENLISTHPKLIVFYNYNYELEIMRELLTEMSTAHDIARNLTNSSDGFVKNSSGLMVPSSTTSDEKLILPSSTVKDPPWNLNPSQEWTQDPAGVQTRTSVSPKDASESPASSGTQTRSSTSVLEHPPVNLSEESMISETPEKDSKFTQVSQTKNFGSKSVNQPSKNDSVFNIQTPSLAVGAGGSFGWAEWNGHKHEPIPDTDRWVYLVQYSSGSEGWNCIDTDAMAFWSLTYSWKQFQQAQGRIDRMNTPFTDLHYYIMMTDSMAEKPVRMSLDKKRDFQPK
jgi:hypothetical protein